MLKELLIAAAVIVSQYSPEPRNGWDRVKPSLKHVHVVEYNVSLNEIKRIQDEVLSFDFFYTGEYWFTPQETMIYGGGDCKDFAVYASYRLLQEGFSKQSLTILVGLMGTEAHAVLRVKLDDDYFIIDNTRTKVVTPKVLFRTFKLLYELKL